MSRIHELRDAEEVRRIVLQGLWLQRAQSPQPSSVQTTLQTSLEVLNRGHPLLPTGFIADLYQLLYLAETEEDPERQRGTLHGVPATLLLSYEDQILGKIMMDWSLLRASELVRKYRKPRDRALGMVFILEQIRQHCALEAIEFPPGILQTLQEQSPQELLRLGYESLMREGLHPLLAELSESLIVGFRRVGQLLLPEDLEELRLGSAFDPEGERVALRQVLEAGQRLEQLLPRYRTRLASRERDVPTHVLDEDTYPVGGFSSISNRGSIESLLHSQLAYIEDDRPDLFDIKYLRDELLYYSRDENQFLRRRRSFVLVFAADLVEAIRFKDPGFPYQRGILLLALVHHLIRKWIDWLSSDALVFHLVFPIPAGTPRRFALQPEYDLLVRLLREELLNHSVVVHLLLERHAVQTASALQGEAQEWSDRLKQTLPAHAIRVSGADLETGLEEMCGALARRSLSHCLMISRAPQNLRLRDTALDALLIQGAIPMLESSVVEPISTASDDPLSLWGALLSQILQRGL